MKKLILSFCVAVMLYFTATSVWALMYYTPTLDDLTTWEMKDVSSLGLESSLTVVDDRPWSEDVKFSGTFTSNSTAYNAYILIGKDVNLDLSGYDQYMLSVFNGNENPWNYALYIKDGSGNQAFSTVTTIAKDGRATIVLSLSGLLVDLSDITQIGFEISALVPLGDPTQNSYPDYTFETKVAPVPEPATIMLMGAGLVGLGGWARRRQNKKS